MQKEIYTQVFTNNLTASSIIFYLTLTNEHLRTKNKYGSSRWNVFKSQQLSFHKSNFLIRCLIKIN